jgi:hypothetical protein
MGENRPENGLPYGRAADEQKKEGHKQHELTGKES